jgi:hypothetical protein
VVFSLVDKFITVIDEVNRLDIAATKQLSLLLNKMREFHRENKHLFLSIREESNHPKGKIHEQMQLRFHKIIESVSRIVERGIKNKEFKGYSPHLVASVILSLTFIFAHKAICKDDGQELTDSDVIFKILMNGLAK